MKSQVVFWANGWSQQLGMETITDKPSHEVTTCSSTQFKQSIGLPIKNKIKNQTKIALSASGWWTSPQRSCCSFKAEFL